MSGGPYGHAVPRLAVSFVTPPESTQVAVELERIRGTLNEGFATLNGRLDMSLQRTTQLESDLKDLTTRTDRDVTGLDQRIDALERARWPLPSLAALVGLAGLTIALVQLLGK